ncbi:hypothetical protein KM043_010628 [Ampulex compressa]|nr:hypothetical protein KM043_010628 [Ampulex compressa]
MQICLISSSDSNATHVSAEEEDDDSLPEITFAEFKERYRRLIPYMTFYVANNYANAQAALARAISKGQSEATAARKAQQAQFTRPIEPPRRFPNQNRANPPNQEKKFVPSLQYDPRNTAGEGDYFQPIRYNAKINYEDYNAPFQAYQGQKALYPEITTASSPIHHKETGYFANVRPLRPYATSVRDHYPRKQSSKPTHGNLHEDYVLDYAARPSANVGLNYPGKEFEGLRYIPAQLHSGAQQPIKIHEPLVGRQPSILQLHRNQGTNLNRIIESFQLTERLPEALNRENIDNSIKILVEILGLLHGSKKENFPQVPLPPLPPLIPPSLLSGFPTKLSDYESYKNRRPNRPKVITETRFQATPNPLFISDDPERYKLAYPTNVKTPPHYEDDSNDQRIVEYYTPYVQDIQEDNGVAYKSTPKPPIGEVSTEHSYRITEDLSDDILENNRYTVQTTTQVPGANYPERNEISPQEPSVPQTSLKYGATRGKPNVDYPAYATIPETDFSCKEQRYKGFFGDPDTGCQVWHYCDLNGGKSSFLCPNGTIFSQVALTCDWWFNVKCETTTQLYVLNERLYKYILPIMPKFPEDFTGPEVDRYLEIKFKEMEAKLKEKKLKKQKEGKEKVKDKLQTLDDNQ